MKMLKNALSDNVKESEKKFLDLSLYSDLNQHLMGSLSPSSIRVLWKSVQQFLCNHAHKPTNQWTR